MTKILSGIRFVILGSALVVNFWAGAANANSDILRERWRFALNDSSDVIVSARFNSDSSKILLVGRRTAEIFSTVTGERLIALETEKGYLDNGYKFEWQPNGSGILQYGKRFSKDATATLWDGDTGNVKTVIEEDRGIRNVEWSATGKWILTVGGSKPETYLRQLTYSVRDQEGKRLNGLTLDLYRFHSVQFSKSGERVILSTDPRFGAKSIRVFDAETGRPENEFGHDLKNVSSITYAVFLEESPDGRLFCGQIEFSKGVMCWDVRDPSRSLFSLLDNKTTGDRIFLGFSGDSKSIAVLRSREKVIEIADSGHGTTKFIIDLPNGVRRVRRNDGLGFYDYGNAWSHDGRYYVVSDVEKEVSIWDVENKRLVSRRPAIWSSDYDWFVGTLPTDYEKFNFNRANGWLLSISSQTVRIWNPSTGALLFELDDTEKKHADRTYHALVSNWSPDGRFLSTAADRNRSVIMWDVRR